MRTGVIVLAASSLLVAACVQRLHQTLTEPDEPRTLDRAAPRRS